MGTKTMIIKKLFQLLFFLNLCIFTNAFAEVAAPPKQLKNNNCLACHSITTKIVGPAFKDVAAKYKSDPNAMTKIITNIKNGGKGNWGEIPMPPQPQINDADLKTISQWVLKQ